MKSSQEIGLRRKVMVHLSALGTACLIFTGCGHLQLSDSFPPADSPPDLSFPVVLDLRVLVVGRHSAAVTQASDDLQRLGMTVIQRDRIERILDEQDPHFNDPLAVQAYVMRNAGLSGAEVVVLVDVEGSKDAPGVIVKGIDVETGDMLWSGGVISTRETMEDEYNRVVIDLTHRAVMDGFTKPQGGSTSVLFSHP